MGGMRRMLVSVAALAAVLLAPSAAFAALSPALTQPTSPTNVSPIPLTWSNVSLVGETITYQVYRANEDCSTATVFDPVGAPVVDLVSSSDAPPDGTYCYYVTADDGLLVSLPSNTVGVTLDTAPPVISVTPAGGDGCVHTVHVHGHSYRRLAVHHDGQRRRIYAGRDVRAHGRSVCPAFPERGGQRRPRERVSASASGGPYLG